MIQRLEPQSDPHVHLLKGSKWLRICQLRLKHYVKSLKYMAQLTFLTHSVTSSLESSTTCNLGG